MFRIELSSASRKQYNRLEFSVQRRFVKLFKNIAVNPFLNKLSENTYHAHAQYHWVAVWTVDKNAKLVTITYIGSREGVPY